MRFLTQQSFFTGADELRARFETCVGPSRKGSGDRFVWDYWHVPAQYTYFRTPALNVLPPSMLARFTGALGEWGLANLGTGRITVPWLSYYVEGCRQELHSDVEQGEWSYTYSLSPWEGRRFTGGETLLASPLLMDYWASFDPGASSEGRQLLERVPAAFDQLCVFDSRLPHGVALVEGTRDPLEGRVALHGWFHASQPSLEGGLDLERAAAPLEDIRVRARADQARLGPLLGHAAWHAHIGAAGEVEDVTLIVHNLVRGGPGAADPTELLAAEQAHLRATRFPTADGPSELRLPLGG